MDNILPGARSVLATTPTRWLSLAQALSTDLLSQPPAPEQWSPLECLQHLVDTEQVFHFRVQAFLAGQDFPAFDPISQGTKLNAYQSAIDLAEEFARLRRDGLALLAQIEPSDLQRQVRHEELGLVTLGEMVHEWAAHDLNHTVQAERAMMQPFIEGCGPWQVYFAEHLVNHA
ncbi:MAG: DinB family protein [Chloroflexota bacterium]|nr:DinB family protein [Chloroflexota bacterium]